MSEVNLIGMNEGVGMSGVYRGTFAVVDLTAIAQNLRAVRSVMNSSVRMLLAVKANGYGHGAVPVAHTANAVGVDMLGVASLEEGLELRSAGIDTPILVFGRVPFSGLSTAAKEDITVTITSKWNLDEIPACSPPLKAHVKIDTGMSRLGFRESDDVISLLQSIKTRKDVDVTGIFSHFACADAVDVAHADAQFHRFGEVLQKVSDEGLCPPLVHMANSAGTLRNRAWHLDMVRIGVSAYGLAPSPDFPLPITLTPALHLYTTVARTEWIPAGETVGYGATFQAKRPTRVATVAVGYADGYFRLLSNRASVLIKGQRVPVIGNVCMDQMMLDVTDIPEVEPGDIATVYGRQSPDEWDSGAIQKINPTDLDSFICETFSKARDAGNPVLSLNELAERAETISYEIMCALSPRIPKIYVKV